MPEQNTQTPPSQTPSVSEALTSAASGIEAEVARFEGRNVNTNLPPVSNSNKEAEKLTQTVNDQKTTSQQTTTQQTTQQSKEGEQKKVVEPPKITDFNKLLGNNLIPTTTTTIAKDKEKEKERNNLQQQPPVQPSPELDANGKPKRDLTGFGEHEAKLLQQMSNEAFDHFSKNLKEARAKEAEYNQKSKAYEDKIKALETGKQILPDSYYENPNAFILSPEFQTMQQGVELARNVQQHWETQLERVEKGETWVDLINDPKTGQLVYGNEFEVTDENKARMKVQLTKYLQGAQLQVHNETGKIQQFIGGFTERHNNYVNGIRDIEKRAMPVFENEKGVEREFLDKTVRPLIKSWGIREDNPAFGMLAKNVALVSMLMTALKDITSTNNSKTKIEQDQQRGGPTNANLGGNSGNGPARPATPTLDDFNRLLRS